MQNEINLRHHLFICAVCGSSGGGGGGGGRCWGFDGGVCHFDLFTTRGSNQIKLSSLWHSKLKA